jgi:predicted dehydrogenase
MKLRIFAFPLLFALSLALLQTNAQTPARANATVSADSPIRVAIVGLVHDHALGIFAAIARNHNVTLVGVAEPDKNLVAQYAQRLSLASALFYADEARMLEETHPDAVLVYTSIVDHRKAIETAAQHHVAAVMVEKPLSTSMEDALAIRRIANATHMQVLVNYETTWYRSNAEALREVDNGTLGTIRRVVVHDGHEGPQEIGVSKTFLGWLTDPKQAGAGAMFDFGCYGADLMTRIMHGETPVSVTAVAMTDKPAIYPNVDDDATIIVRYKTAVAVLQPSWTWSFARKDMEVYGTDGYVITEAADHVRTRYKNEKADQQHEAPSLATAQQSSLDYLAAVLHDQIETKDDQKRAYDLTEGATEDVRRQMRATQRAGL